MQLYLISQSKNNEYDSYDSAVVAANSADEAQHIHPSKRKDGTRWWENEHLWDWTLPKNIEVKYIGTTKLKAGVICASFNAG